MTEHNEETPNPVIEVIGGALHLTNVMVGGKLFNGTIAGKEITGVEYRAELDPGDGNEMIIHSNTRGIRFPIENLEAFNKLEAELLHPDVPLVYDSYGLQSSNDGKYWIIGFNSGSEACFIDLDTAYEVCFDTSNENQFILKVFYEDKIARFNTTRQQWDNFHQTVNGRLVRINLNAEMPNTPE